MDINLAVRKHVSKYLYCMYFIQHLEKEMDERCKMENRERTKQEERVFVELMQKSQNVAGIKVYGLPTDRIGETVARGLEIGQEDILNQSKNIIGVYIPYFSGWKGTNLRVLAGFSRKSLIVNENNITAVKILLKKFRNKLDISEFYKWDEIRDGIWDVKLGQRFISMNETEIEESEKMISSQNIIDLRKPFICFAARDQAYLSGQYPNDDVSHHLYRNSKLQDMAQGIAYCNEQNLQCVLIGRKYDENNILHGVAYIDYPGKYYNELLDWYFMSNCKFYLGNSTGVIMVAQVSGIPVAVTDLIPSPVNIPRVIWKEEDIVIFKKLWSESKGRYLTLIEMWDLMGIENLANTELYEKRGLKVINNSQEEIYELAKEMNERLDGVYSNIEKAEKLREKYLNLLKKWCKRNNYDYDNIWKVRIGTDFLDKNPYLFGEE